MNFGSLAILALGLLLARLAVGGLDRHEARFATVAFYVHIAGSFAHWQVKTRFYGDINDASGYESFGVQLARLMDLDFTRFAPEVAKLLVHITPTLPFQVNGDTGTSTGTMAAIAAICIFLAGKSMLSMCLVGACTAWLGQLFLYRVVREELEGEDLLAARVGVFYVPSVIFWGGGFEKEAFVLGCFGVLLFASYRVLKSGALRYLPLMTLGGVGVAMVKAYTLVPYVLAVAAFIYGVRATAGGGRMRIRPAYLVVGAVVAIFGLVILGRVFPEFAAEKVAESTTQTREAFRTMNGGSNVDLGGEGTPGFLMLPMAFINTFFRPAIFDVKNAPMLIAAVETTFLSFTVVSLATSPRGALRGILPSPFMFASLTFALAFGIGVGSATGNLGALSRYRVPMMPLYVTTLLILRQRERSREVVSARARRSDILTSVRSARSRRA